MFHLLRSSPRALPPQRESEPPTPAALFHDAAQSRLDTAVIEGSAKLDDVGRFYIPLGEAGTAQSVSLSPAPLEVTTLHPDHTAHPNPNERPTGYAVVERHPVKSRPILKIADLPLDGAQLKSMERRGFAMGDEDEVYEAYTGVDAIRYGGSVATREIKGLVPVEATGMPEDYGGTWAEIEVALGGFSSRPHLTRIAEEVTDRPILD